MKVDRRLYCSYSGCLSRFAKVFLHSFEPVRLSPTPMLLGSVEMTKNGHNHPEKATALWKKAVAKALSGANSGPM